MTSTNPVLRELDPDQERATDVASLTSLIWLTLGAFAIGTEGFMIAGLLPALARDLDVGLASAGHLVTAFSLAYVSGCETSLAAATTLSALGSASGSGGFVA